MRNHPRFKAYVALGAVCLFWGTTYAAIRIALESMPPLVLISLRFSISGAITLAAAAVAGLEMPRGKELIRTALNGLLVLGVGNAALAVAEQWIPSGLAALFITAGPFWMVGFEALVPGGASLHGPSIAGMVLGLAGVVFLVGPAGLTGNSGSTLAGFLILQLGCAGWSLGSILQRRSKTRAHLFASGGVQQLATGLVYAIPAMLMHGKPVAWTSWGVLSLAYLVTFGSIVGYTAFIYAMETLPVTVVSIYNYINPVVAVFLGWLFFRESFGAREAIAMCIIFAGVAIVKSVERRPA